MTRSDLIDRVWRHGKEQKKHRVTRSAAMFWVPLVIDELADMIVDCPDVTIMGLGRFTHRYTKERHFKGLKGSPVVHAHDRLGFTPSYILGMAVKEGMNSEQYHDLREKTNALKRGEYLKGYELRNNIAQRIEEDADAEE